MNAGTVCFAHCFILCIYCSALHIVKRGLMSEVIDYGYISVFKLRNEEEQLI